MRSQIGARQLEPMKISLTSPQEVIDLEELLRLVINTVLTYGVRCLTLSCEERCGRMIANPVKSACRSTTARMIPRSWLLEQCGERGDYVIRGFEGGDCFQS